MDTLIFPGIVVAGNSPQQRRDAWSKMTEEAQTKAVKTFLLANQVVLGRHGETIAEQAGLSLKELIQTPFALRGVLLGLQKGVRCVDLETRSRYKKENLQQIRLEDPLVVYDPNELPEDTSRQFIFRAQGFFWRKSASIWDTYFSIRIANLVPETFRHVNYMWYSHWISNKNLYLEEETSAAVSRINRGINYFSKTIIERKEEFAQGFCHRTWETLPILAYLADNYDQLHSDNFEKIVTSLLEANEDYYDDIQAFLKRSEDFLDLLLFGEISWDNQKSDAQVRTRFLWDVVQRAAFYEEDTFKKLWPRLEELITNDFTLNTISLMDPVYMDESIRELQEDPENFYRDPYALPIDDLLDEMFHLIGRSKAWKNGDSERFAQDLEQLNEAIREILPATAKYMAKANHDLALLLSTSDKFRLHFTLLKRVTLILDRLPNPEREIAKKLAKYESDLQEEIEWDDSEEYEYEVEHEIKSLHERLLSE